MAATILQFPIQNANDNTGDRTPPSGGAGQVHYLPINTESPGIRFKRAYHEACIARAEYELQYARYLAWVDLDKAPEQNHRSGPYSPETLFEKMRLAVFKLAVTPATNKRQLASKKRVIGKVWLKAEGEVFDALRAGVEIDELRFSKKAA